VQLRRASEHEGSSFGPRLLFDVQKQR